MSNKRGQQKLSFGMIFSIILIVIFVSFAGYGIYKLIQIQEDVKIDKFAEDLNEDVEELWKSGTYGKQTPSPYELPKKIDFVCFVKSEYDDNLRLLKREEGLNRTEGEYEIEHIDIESMVGEKDKYCIKNTEGEIEFTLIKEEDNPNITIKQAE